MRANPLGPELGFVRLDVGGHILPVEGHQVGVGLPNVLAEASVLRAAAAVQNQAGAKPVLAAGDVHLEEVPHGGATSAFVLAVRCFFERLCSYLVGCVSMAWSTDVRTARALRRFRVEQRKTSTDKQK